MSDCLQPQGNDVQDEKAKFEHEVAALKEELQAAKAKLDMHEVNNVPSNEAHAWSNLLQTSTTAAVFGHQ